MAQNKIIIVGRGGSGKDFLRKKFEAKGFAHSVSCTSRPKRENEVNGVDYYYVSYSYFVENKDLFYEYDEFNGWRYGTLKSEFEKSDVFVMTPRGVKNLTPEDRARSIIFFINPDREIIYERLLARGDKDKPERRMATDDADFDGFTDYDIEIKNHDF